MKIEEFIRTNQSLASMYFTLETSNSEFYKFPNYTKYLAEILGSKLYEKMDELYISVIDFLFTIRINHNNFSNESIEFANELTMTFDYQEAIKQGNFDGFKPKEIKIEKLELLLGDFYKLLPNLDYTNYYFTCYLINLNWETMVSSFEVSTHHTLSASLSDPLKNKAKIFDKTTNKSKYIDIYDRKVYEIKENRYVIFRKNYQAERLLLIYWALVEFLSVAKSDNKKILLKYYVL